MDIYTEREIKIFDLAQAWVEKNLPDLSVDDYFIDLAGQDLEILWVYRVEGEREIDLLYICEVSLDDIINSLTEMLED